MPDPALPRTAVPTPVVPPWRYRLAVLSRLLAALGGTYALASAVAAASAVLLPRLGLPRSDAVLWGTLLALLLMPVVMLGCFCCRRERNAWLGSLGMAAVLAATALASNVGLQRWLTGAAA